MSEPLKPLRITANELKNAAPCYQNMGFASRQRIFTTAVNEYFAELEQNPRENVMLDADRTYKLFPDKRRLGAIEGSDMKMLTVQYKAGKDGLVHVITADRTKDKPGTDFEKHGSNARAHTFQQDFLGYIRQNSFPLIVKAEAEHFYAADQPKVPLPHDAIGKHVKSMSFTGELLPRYSFLKPLEHADKEVRAEYFAATMEKFLGSLEVISDGVPHTHKASYWGAGSDKGQIRRLAVPIRDSRGSPRNVEQLSIAVNKRGSDIAEVRLAQETNNTHGIKGAPNRANAFIREFGSFLRQRGLEILLETQEAHFRG